MNRRNLIKTITGFAAAIFGTKAVANTKTGIPFDEYRFYRGPFIPTQDRIWSDGKDSNPMPEPMITTAQAMDHLRWTMQNDPDYAHSWHANIAVFAQDEGLGWHESQTAAANFMKIAFDAKVDDYMPGNPGFRLWVKGDVNPPRASEL